MKKLFISIVTAFILVTSVFSVEFQARLLPNFSVSTNSLLKKSISGTVSFDILPITFRGRDDLYFSLQGSGSLFLINTIDNPYMLSADFGVGYNYRIIDRVSVSLEALVGAYLFPNYEYKTSDNKVEVFEGMSGVDLGARLSGNYYIRPSLIASAFVSYKHYFYDPSLMEKFEFGLGITYNFTKGIFASSNIDTLESSTQPLFPVFYSRYDDHSFGSLTFVNNEKNDITDVSVAVFIPQYMSTQKVIAQIPYVKRGEEFSVELTAFLNENILNLLQTQLVDAKVIVSYRSLGKSLVKEESLELQSLTRNSMSWEDDRRAAAFVSGHDGSAQLFARQLEANLRSNFNSSTTISQQYAAAIYGALKAYGINYVIDPSSAFTDNTGTSDIDFLQFPYQTLLYHGGDCDDLTILNCSLLEALGVSTAFITVPGHIFMAFDSGVSVSNAGKVNGGRTIIFGGKVWVPVEITVTQDSYSLALQLGWKEWNSFKNEAAIIPLEEAWKEYSNVSIPDSEVTIEMPSKEKLIREFNNAMKAVR